MSGKLLFIYNAKSGALQGVLDSLHKIFNPESYKCSLCKITHGAFGEKKAWKNFRKASCREMEFLHADEFKRQYASKFGHKFNFPVVLAEGISGLEIFISREELSQVSSEKELIGLIERRSS
ncbi:GTPase [Zunongwangia sp. F363]|uniref:GTPase n=1 Tax=Autumnicola tepida TaxID=3075595 RepID=A0ABU3C7R7_9FLAO|nr:GTPase [Zunongwangia sp. F363]MDT0642384.1 GTPase [Zunongwangia sp. F363]